MVWAADSRQVQLAAGVLANAAMLIAEDAQIKKDFAKVSTSGYRLPMSELDYPDQHYLRAAHGWLELGRPQEAMEEVERISPSLYFHPGVLEVRWKLAVEAADWSGALEIARDLVQVAPERASGWISRSFCLHELKETAEAWKCLFPAARKFPTVSIIRYNLACYACQLGRLVQARNWLKKAMAAGAKAQIKAMALSDADLKPLWPVIEKI